MQNELKSLSIRRSDTGKNVQQMIEENTIDVQSVAEVLKKRLSGYVNQPQVYDLGYVISSGDGIVRVGGLARCRNDELLEFENGIYGIAMDLALDSVGAVLLDDEAGVSVGTQVKGTGLVTKVPVEIRCSAALWTRSAGRWTGCRR
jgi:F0F1-type ATP synthase alpha subunit